MIIYKFEIGLFLFNEKPGNKCHACKEAEKFVGQHIRQIQPL